LKTSPANILISGSSRGLGREIANNFRNMGLNVTTMGYQSKEDVDIRCDLLDIMALDIELKKLYEKQGPIDILVCNAGGGKTPDSDFSKNQLRKYFFEINFETAKNLLNSAEPYLKSPGASVVGISSIAALTEIAGAPIAYSEAKAKLNKFLLGKALELSKRKVRVNLISPGNLMFQGSRWHEISRENPAFVEELLENRVPLHEFISPEEIASAILYLSSSQARNITGTNLVIDGGQIL